MYGQSLAEYASFVPDPPDIYEPGSVEFDGWYQNQQCTGEEYVLTKHTMPASDLLLYAKWKQASHTVQIFPSVEDAQNLKNQIGETQTILHGSSAVEPDEPKNEPYQFVGWFYTLNGVEHAYDFGDMPVVRDLILYAKWSSNVLVDYTVQYLKEGTTESVAPDTTGSGLAGYPKTFEAVEAPDGWFPTVKSHSITLDMDVRTRPYRTELFTRYLPTLPVLDEGECVLEVKYNGFLPSHIVWMLEGVPKQRMAVSKYVKCMSVLE